MLEVVYMSWCPISWVVYQELKWPYTWMTCIMLWMTWRHTVVSVCCLSSVWLGFDSCWGLNFVSGLLDRRGVTIPTNVFQSLVLGLFNWGNMLLEIWCHNLLSWPPPPKKKSWRHNWFLRQSYIRRMLQDYKHLTNKEEQFRTDRASKPNIYSKL